MINCFGVIGVARKMSADGGARFRESKTVYKKGKLLEKLLPRQLNIKTNGRNNFWRMADFSVCYSSSFTPGGLFKDYALHYSLGRTAIYQH